MPKEPTRNGNYRSNGGKPPRGGDRVYGPGRSEGSFDWSAVDASEIAHFLCCVTGHGDMVSFSVTSDGGAGAIAIISDGARLKSYPTTADEALERMHGMMDDMGYAGR